MASTRIRGQRRAATVALAFLLAVLLAVEQPARAQDPSSFGNLIDYPYAVKTAQSVVRHISPALWTAGGVGAGTIILNAAGTPITVGGASGALATGTASTGVVLCGSTIVCAGAAAVGIGVGWGVVESGLWDWATGEDPIAPDEDTVVTFAGSDYIAEESREQWGSTNGFVHFEVIADGTLGPYEAFQAVPTMRSDWPEVDSDPHTPLWASCNPDPTDFLAGRSTQSLIVTDSDGVSWEQKPYKIIVHNCNTGEYRLEGQTTTETVAAQDRRLETEAECIEIGTGATTSAVAYSDPYAPGDEPQSPRVECPPGHTVGDVEVRRSVGGDPSFSTIEDTEVIGGREADQELRDAVADPTEEYADCFDGSCTLMIWRQAPGEDTHSRCDEEETVCVGWVESVQQGLAQDGEYECRWGSHVMPLTDCMEPFREIDAGTSTEPGTSNTPKPATLPGTSGNPIEVESGCQAGGGDWWNPFDNVAGAIGCALQWAFVPQTTGQQFQQLRTEASAKPPFSAFAATTGVVQGVTEGWDTQGCKIFPSFSPTEIGVPVEAGRPPCEPPQSPQWATIYGIAQAGVVVATGFGMWSMARRSMGYHATDDGTN